MEQTIEASPEAHEGEHCKTVSITIDGKHHEIRKGEHSVAELKRLGHVPTDYELAGVYKLFSKKCRIVRPDGRFIDIGASVLNALIAA